MELVVLGVAADEAFRRAARFWDEVTVTFGAACNGFELLGFVPGGSTNDDGGVRLFATESSDDDGVTVAFSVLVANQVFECRNSVTAADCVPEPAAVTRELFVSRNFVILGEVVSQAKVEWAVKMNLELIGVTTINDAVVSEELLLEIRH